MKFHFSFAFFDEFCDFSAKFWWKFPGISQKLSGNDKMYWDFAEKCDKHSKNARNFRNLWEIFIFHFIFSFVSLINTWMRPRFPWRGIGVAACRTSATGVETCKKRTGFALGGPPHYLSRAGRAASRDRTSSCRLTWAASFLWLQFEEI